MLSRSAEWNQARSKASGRVGALPGEREKNKQREQEKFSCCESLGVPARNPVRALTHLVGGDSVAGESGATSTETLM